MTDENTRQFLLGVADLIQRHFGQPSGFATEPLSEEAVAAVEKLGKPTPTNTGDFLNKITGPASTPGVDLGDVPDRAEVRTVELKKVDLRVLRRLLRDADPENADADGKKDAVIAAIVGLEGVTGKSIEELARQEPTDAADDDEGVADDDSVTPEEEAVDDEDDEDVELTREELLELPLRELKSIALDNGVDEADLKGLDVEAIVELLDGPADDEDGKVDTAPAEEDDDEEEVIELTDEQIKGMSLAELQAVADDLDIAYKRSTTQDQLIELILSAE